MKKFVRVNVIQWPRPHDKGLVDGDVVHQPPNLACHRHHYHQEQQPIMTVIEGTTTETAATTVENNNITLVDTAWTGMRRIHDWIVDIIKMVMQLQKVTPILKGLLLGMLLHQHVNGLPKKKRQSPRKNENCWPNTVNYNKIDFNFDL